jgi:hypothetical protein
MKATIKIPERPNNQHRDLNYVLTHQGVYVRLKNKVENEPDSDVRIITISSITEREFLTIYVGNGRIEPLSLGGHAGETFIEVQENINLSFTPR